MVMHSLMLAALLAVPLAAQGPGGITDTARSPHAKLHSVGMNEVRWTHGFWSDRFDTTYKVTIPTMWQAMQVPGNGALFRNLRVAAGLEQAPFEGRNWSDGDVYKWIETVAYVYGITHDKDLDRQMDAAIEVIAKAQAPDGYISTQMQLTGRKRWVEPAKMEFDTIGQPLQAGAPPRRTSGNHEFYNFGHLFTAAAVHRRATGKSNFLAVARKAADYLYREFHRPPASLLNFGYNPSQIMGLVELYRVTGDRRYLDLAGVFVDVRGAAPGGVDGNQSRTPLRKETQAVGHVVLGTYLFCGAADILAETGEKELWSALDRLWQDVTTRKMYVTGGTAALHGGRSPHGDLVIEAFGAPHELPNRSGYNETCANIANAMWNWRMLAATGEAKYADVMERVLYNSLPSAIGLSGDEYFYTNPLRRYGGSVPLLTNDSRKRWKNNAEPGASGGFCCPPSVSRTLASVHTLAYSQSAGAVWVNLYGSNTLDNGLVKLAQETDYPWDGKVRIKIERVSQPDFALMLRIPGWAVGAAIRVNGKPGPAAAAGTYVEVKRKWAAGDKLELDLPMEVRLVAANPLVEEDRNQTAVMRGPIVYCLESPDLPAGVGIDDVAIPAAAKFTARHDPSLLKGVTVIEGQARLIRQDNWSGLLYRAIRPQPAESTNIRLIPYYAWANRGISDMTVWMPLIW